MQLVLRANLVILGKLVLRYLFAGLLDAEISQDAKTRETLLSEYPPIEEPVAEGRRDLRITVPETSFGEAPGVTTPKGQSDGIRLPNTPGMSIAYMSPSAASNAMVSPRSEPLTTHEEEAAPTSAGPVSPGKTLGHDYFTQGASTSDSPTKQGSQSAQNAVNGTASSSTEATDSTTAQSGKFMGKLKSFGTRKLSRTSSDLKQSAPAVPSPRKEAKDVAMEQNAEKDGQSEGGQLADPFEIDDTFESVLRKIHNQYLTAAQTRSGRIDTLLSPLTSKDTPVLKIPGSTVVIISEDRPASGGLIDVYRGTISRMSKDAQEIEKVAPSWLGELLLLDKIPVKDTVKVSFVLRPGDESLPHLANSYDLFTYKS